MRDYFDSDRDQQPTPPVIPKLETDFDPSGLIATAQPGGPTQTSQNAFFANLGTNGRTCFTGPLIFIRPRGYRSSHADGKDKRGDGCFGSAVRNRFSYTNRNYLSWQHRSDYCCHVVT